MGERISDDELRQMLETATPGPWLAANNPGDWGLAGAWAITTPDGNPYEWDQRIAHVEYTTPYCAGASKAELDAADVAKANAALIALSPALAAEVLQLREALADANRKLGGGCDANGGGAHSLQKQGTYVFCGNCGETMTSTRYTRAALSADAMKREQSNG